MSIVAIREGTALAPSAWLSRLAIKQDELQLLTDSRILRPTERGEYALTFVGLVIFKDRLLWGQPKFGTGSVFDLQGTLRILRGYFGRSADRRPVVDHLRDPEFGDAKALREFDALIGLLDWFSAYGVYRREQSRLSSAGRPDWTRTMARCQPLIMQGQVIYPSTIGERREGMLNEVSRIQMSLLRSLMERYGMPVPALVRDEEARAGRAFDHWPVDDAKKARLSGVIARERRDVFRSDSLHLLKLLSTVLETPLSENTARPQIFGTTAFYAVWEDACRALLADDSAAGATLGQPVWLVKGADGAEHRYPHAQIPDLAIRAGSTLFIMDAKYYFPFPASRPGAPDIVKQLYYAESLHDPAAEVRSVFLLPWPGAVPPKFLGHATIEGAARSFSHIEAWGLDPDDLFAQYPVRSARRAESVVRSILGNWQGVSEIRLQAPAHVRS